MKRKILRITMAILLTGAMLIGNITGILPTQTAYAADANNLKSTIDSYTGGEGASGRLYASVSGSTVTVTGSMSNVSETLTLNIDEGMTVNWTANIESTEVFSPVNPEDAERLLKVLPLIALDGAGSFVVSGSSAITAHYAVALRAASDATVSITVKDTARVTTTGTSNSGNVTIQLCRTIETYGDVKVEDNASLEAYNATVIYAQGDASQVTVSGGTLTNTATVYSNTVIIMKGQHSHLCVSGGTVKALGQNGQCLSSDGGDITISGNALIRSEVNGGAIHLSKDGSKIDIHGGVIESPSACVSGTSADTQITVYDGTITSVGGPAISIPDSTITVHGGTIRTQNVSHDYQAILGGTVTIDGGAIYGDGLWVVYASTVNISGTAKVQTTATDTIAIRASVVNISGGQVIASNGNAIYIIAGSGYATVSGGAVFSYADKLLCGTVDQDGTISFFWRDYNESRFTGPTDTGMVIAWDNTNDITEYTAGDMSNIIKAPDTATAVWGKQGEQGGIYYTNGANTGFIPVPEVSITGGAEKQPAVNGGGTAEVTYAGNGIDLTSLAALFTVTDGAGARTYTLEEGGSGAGSIGPDGKTLIVTRAGNFTIGLTTEESATHQAGSKGTATLMVSKGTQTAPTGLGAANPTVFGGSDGKIIGLIADTAYEYAKDSGDYLGVVSNASGEITGLAAGVYTVRLAENGLFLASPDAQAVTLINPTTPITVYAIAGVVPPVALAVPGTAIIETEEYTGTVSWSPDDNPFDQETVYTATITLTPKNGFTLTGVPANCFTVAGATSVTNDEDSGVITAVFPSTGDITAPALSGGTAARTSATEADIGFTTSEEGTAYYKVVENGAAAPVFNASDWTSLGAVSGTVADKSVTLTAGAKDIFIVVADAANNASSPLKIPVGAAYPKNPVPTMEVYVGGNRDFSGNDIVDGALDERVNSIITYPQESIALGGIVGDGIVRLFGVAVGTTSMVVCIDDINDIYITVPISIIDPPEGLKPVLSNASYNRTSDTEAMISFDTDKAGTVCYLVQDKGQDEPILPDDVVKFESAVTVDETGTVSLPVTLTEGAKDVYLLFLEETYELPSEILKIEVAAYSASGTAPAITTTTLPNGTVGTPYSETLDATGDTPIAWTLESGNLPNGLTLNETTGVISGTPTATGTFNFTVKASNAAGDDTKALSITINAAVPTVDGVTVTPATAEVEKGTTRQFGAAVTGTNNPANTVTWSLDGYSGSSTINEAGLLTVDANETEPALTVRATSTVDGTKYGEATVTVTDSPPTPVYSISLDRSGTHTFPIATENYGTQTPLSVTITNTGNQPTGDLSIDLSGTAASSFTVTPNTISSIATATDATFTVTPEAGLSAGTHIATVTVSGGNSISESFDVSFTVNSTAPSGTAPSITTTTLPGGVVGSAYSVPLAATGDAPIEWTLDSGDLPDGLGLSTDGLISGTPTANGTFNFTVKASNGVLPDATKALSITIDPAGTTTLTITATAAKGGRISPSGNVTVNSGASQTFTITPDNNYSISSLKVDGVSVGAVSAYTFSDVTENHTIAATFRYTGGGGHSSDNDSDSSSKPTITITPAAQPNWPTIGSVTGRVAGSTAQRTFTVTDSLVKTSLEKAQAEAKKQGRTAYGVGAQIALDTPVATGLTLTLERAALNRLVSTGAKCFEITGAPISLTFDAQALSELKKQGTGNATITVKPVTVSGVRNAYDITISYVKDGKTVGITSLGGGTVTLSIPYIPAKGEAIGHLYAVYVDAKGKLNRIAGSAYDTNSRSMIFSTNHFSVYGVGYTAPSAKFSDIGSHWAKESIDYVVGRGLLSGTAETTFAPDTAMTRGMLVTALGRLTNVDIKAYTTNSFTDVTADSTFRPYIEWAYKKGIVQGTGNGKFEPNRAVTREEIAVIFANYAKATGYTLPVTRAATTYADASSIGSAYKTAVTAMQQAGIMMGGSSNKFNPKSSATRAEVSSMLHRYIKLTIDPDTAQGWALNDAGQYLYYKDSKALTGTQTIDGAKYFFNTDGTLKTGWVKDDAGNWRFYSGNQMLVGFWDLGANGNNKTYYFNKDGTMVAGKWLQIDGEWYYFYADGTLAVSTKIDEYEVDENGVRKTK